MKKFFKAAMTSGVRYKIQSKGTSSELWVKPFSVMNTDNRSCKLMKKDRPIFCERESDQRILITIAPNHTRNSTAGQEQ